MLDKYYFDSKYSKSSYKFNFDYDKGILGDILKYKKSGRVLDLGCGEGGLSVALAKKGFNVECVDISKTALEKIKERSKELKLKIRTVTADLDGYTLKKYKDVVLALGILHFLENKKKKISEIKKITSKNGINVIDDFFDRGVIRLYDDWEIIEKEIYRDSDKHKMIYFIARKPL